VTALHVSQGGGPGRVDEVCKRIIDVALTLALAIPALILISAIFFAIRLTSKGPVFYRHKRIGKDGKCLEVWKLRSMLTNGDEVLTEHLAAHPEAREEWELSRKLRNDPRVFPIGRWLRRTSMDELPQLWNVIRGEMSLVGPRPITHDEISRYGDASELYKSVRPGVTGLWQVSGRSNTSYQERIALDEHYATSRCIWLDLHILMRTFPTLLFRHGAC
jgi:lipopolysaccharide/colanic/teichoic acid biosynthesis glycosyltransferase